MENDQTLIFFFSVALLLHNREGLLSCEKSVLPQTLTCLNVKTEPELETLLESAKKLKESTPHSFFHMRELKQIFSRYDELKLVAAFENLESYQCLPIQTDELFFYSYPELLMCPNPCCSNSLKHYRVKERCSKQLLSRT